MKLCSACLLGIKCRYDGEENYNAQLVDLSQKEILIPVCPEQLGGLSTPRIPAETTIDGQAVIEQKGKVLTQTGLDVTEHFLKGAKETLRIAQLYNIKKAILKQRSPSCGSGQIYDGTFMGTLKKGDGVTAALLKAHGIAIISEEDFKS